MENVKTGWKEKKCKIKNVSQLKKRPQALINQGFQGKRQKSPYFQGFQEKCKSIVAVYLVLSQIMP